MRIFSRSHTFYFSNHSFGGRSLGFTLIELLIAAAIIGIVSAIVLTKYSSFDSTVLLKSAAYEIALTLREAQIKSVSVSRSTIGFDYPYGVSFTPGDKEYYIFRYEDAFRYPRYIDASVAVELISTSVLQGSIQILDICVKEYNVTEKCSTDLSDPLQRLDISFRRPEFKGLFFVDDGTGPYNENVVNSSQSTDFEFARIELRSTNGGPIFQVMVGAFGQISVTPKI